MSLSLLKKLFAGKGNDTAKKTVVKTTKPKTLKDYGSFVEDTQEFSVRVSRTMFANICGMILAGNYNEVSGAITVEDDEIVFATLIAEGSVGGVTTDPLHDLLFNIECQEKYGHWPNGDWHSHPSTGYWSSTDVKDQAGQIGMVRGLTPIGKEGTYYALVAGASLDWLVRRFRWVGGEDTVYYADAAPQLILNTGELRPIRRKPPKYEATTVYYPKGSKWEPEPWLKGDKYAPYSKYISDNDLWGEVKAMREEAPDVVAYWMAKHNIKGDWKASVHFVVTHKDKWMNKAIEIDDMLTVQQYPIEDQLQLPLMDDDQYQQGDGLW